MEVNIALANGVNMYTGRLDEACWAFDLAIKLKKKKRKPQQ